MNCSCAKHIHLITLICLYLLSSNQLISAQIKNKNSVSIGAIFTEDQRDSPTESAFKYAVDRINRDPTLLPNTSLVYDIQYVPKDDSFHASKKVCNIIQKGVWALFGSESASISSLLRSVANNLHIPHLSVYWDYRTYRRRPSTANLYQTEAPNANNFTLSLYPHSSALSKAFMDIVLSKHWSRFTLIFEESDDLIKMKDVLRISSYAEKKVNITIMQFDSHSKYAPTVQYQYKRILKDIRYSGGQNIVLSVPKDKVAPILSQAAQLNMLTEYHNYLIATLDIHTLDLSHFQQYPTNITGLTMFNETAQEVVYGMNYGIIYGKPHPISTQKLPTTAALAYDAVTLFARALDDFQRKEQSIFMFPISCESKDHWPYGTKLIRFMKMLSIKGLTGNISFDENGQRTEFPLYVKRLDKTGLSDIAHWNWTKHQFVTKRTPQYQEKKTLEEMKTKVLRVIAPKDGGHYIRHKPDSHTRVGNDKYEGYCVDLLEEIAKVFESDYNSRFIYSISNRSDNSYGSPNATEPYGWSGLIGDLLAHKADLAIADFTTTFKREKAVDFTMPFMNLGISILLRKPSLPEAELFSFLKPFKTEVWLYLASAILGVSLLLWIMSRITPYEWVSGHPCDPDPEELENQFSIGNSLWFTIGSLMQQGSDLSPKAWSTRVLASIWWIFTLIIASSYTANLAASLTLSRMSPSVENAEDLAKQTVIKYGCKESGSTFDFFKDSANPTYQRMYNYMVKYKNDVLVKDNKEGKERVLKEPYAFLMESSAIEYERERDCDLIEIGKWLDNKGYAIATPPNSPYRTPLSNAIVALQDKGMLYTLKKRWWKDKGGGKCIDESKIVNMELNIESLGGVFVVLGIGVGLGCVFAVLEFIWKTMKTARHERDSIGKLIWIEIIRICTCGSSSRPAPNANAKSSIDSDSVREMESMADINNKLITRFTPSRDTPYETRNQAFF